MTKEDFENLRLLSSKKRLELANRYKMTAEEESNYQKLKEEYELLDDSIPKAVFYMHDFLGISYREIAKILNFTYGSIRVYYTYAKGILET